VGQGVVIRKQAIIPAAQSVSNNQAILARLDRTPSEIAITYFFRLEPFVVLIWLVLSLPLCGLIWVGINWSRFLYAALALLSLPFPAIEAIGLGWVPLVYCLISVLSVVLIFLPSSNRWFKAQTQ